MSGPSAPAASDPAPARPKLKLASSLSGASKLQVPTKSKLVTLSGGSGGGAKLGGLRKPGGLGAKKLGVTKLKARPIAKIGGADSGQGDAGFEDIDVTVEKGKKVLAEPEQEKKPAGGGSKYRAGGGPGDAGAGTGITAADRFASPPPSADKSKPVGGGGISAGVPTGSGAYYDAMESERRRKELLQEKMVKEKKEEGAGAGKPEGMEGSMAKLKAMNGDFFAQM